MDSTRITVMLGLIFVLAANAQADPPEPSLMVSDCRVALIRRAALAGSRLGIVREITIAEGDVVEEGQIVALLRDDIARQTLAIAQKEMGNTVELRLQQKISDQATLEYSKALELNRTVPGGYSEIDVKKLKLAAEKSVLQIEQADFLIQMAALRKREAEVTLETYRITAPFSGVVLEVNKQPGEALSAGEVVAEIANFDVMRVEGFIPVATSGRVQRGAAVVVEVSLGESQKVGRFEGRLKHIAPIVNAVSQEVRVWAEVDNKNHQLKDGLKATMSIAVGTAKTAAIDEDRARRGKRQ